MTALLRTFVDIMLLRRGPDDLPPSQFLLYLTLAVAVLVHMPLTWIIFRNNDAVFLTLIVDLGLMVACLWALLRLVGFGTRFGQTLTALLGTSTLLNLASMPFAYWNSSVPVDVPKPPLPSAVILAIVLWSFAVDGHILSRAMSRPFVIGLLIAIAYFFLHTTVLYEFTPVLR